MLAASTYLIAPFTEMIMLEMHPKGFLSVKIIFLVGRMKINLNNMNLLIHLDIFVLFAKFFYHNFILCYYIMTKCVPCHVTLQIVMFHLHIPL